MSETTATQCQLVGAGAKPEPDGSWTITARFAGISEAQAHAAVIALATSLYDECEVCAGSGRIEPIEHAVWRGQVAESPANEVELWRQKEPETTTTCPWCTGTGRELSDLAEALVGQ